LGWEAREHQCCTAPLADFSFFFSFCLLSVGASRINAVAIARRAFCQRQQQIEIDAVRKTVDALNQVELKKQTASGIKKDGEPTR
jgi:hypothetical protein